MGTQGPASRAAAHFAGPIDVWIRSGRGVTKAPPTAGRTPITWCLGDLSVYAKKRERRVAGKCLHLFVFFYNPHKSVFRVFLGFLFFFLDSRFRLWDCLCTDVSLVPMERGLRFGNVGISLVLLLMLRAVSVRTVQLNSLSRTELDTADTVMERGWESSIGDATVEDDENSATGDSEEPGGDNDTNFHQHGR